MDYTINQLAKLAGISTRTLRYYEEIGLLMPQYKTEAGYRIYSSEQVSMLHLIMFYRHMGVPLTEIKNIINASDEEKIEMLEIHLEKLYQEQKQIDSLIENVMLTIKSMKGEYGMKDIEKFEVFKHNMVAENEEKYGTEIREKYGEDQIDAANKKLLAMTQQQWECVERLNDELNGVLKKAVPDGNPENELAQYACKLHQQWIQHYWNFYSKEAHLQLCEIYTQDNRFKAYYEDIVPGCAEFLFEAMKIYLA